jgi:general secretion pathway protein E/type IV pilus assembly protein PilB
MADHSAQLSPSLKQRIPGSIAWKYRVIPKSITNDLLSVYMDQSNDLASAKNQLEVLIGQKIEVELVSKEFIDDSLAKHYIKANNATSGRELNVDSENFISEVIREANHLRCSDIHIEPYQERCRIRMRLDGKLIERYELRLDKYHEYINKIKIISHLDIAEKRLPQDGRILIKEKGYQYDIRVSILPTLHGEKAVLRLLSSDASNLNIEDLGFTPKQLQDFKDAIAKTQGLVLISGPTGSGKTTSLYAALKTLNKVNSNILTIEDPIEYTLEGINQVQLKEKIGLDFSKTLRTFLRQDPDIIMVGEIRDVDTAQMAIRAAMTGHLVMSTLHTNSAYGIVSRLIEMGVSGYLIADTLNIAIAQRLVRTLCKTCKHKVEGNGHLPLILSDKGIVGYYEPKGCATCHGTGYHGRKAIYEMIPVTEEIRNHILSGNAEPPNINTLADNAIELFKNGETSLEEIYSYLI